MRAQSTHTLQRKISVEIKVLESLAYTCADTDTLLNLLERIKGLQEEIRTSLPQAEGLLLRPVSLLKRAKKIKLKYKHLAATAASYSSLEAARKRGRKRQHWKLQRVGIKAKKLRETASSSHSGLGTTAAKTASSSPGLTKPALAAGTKHTCTCTPQFKTYTTLNITIGTV